MINWGFLYDDRNHFLGNQVSYTNNKNDTFNKLCAILEIDMLNWGFLYDNRNQELGIESPTPTSKP
jgi:hypothetical protein